MEINGLTIKAEELRTMLEEKEHVIVLDVRPKEQREEWQIGSLSGMEIKIKKYSG
jgi:rhodanese-related sulfurtransferase